MVMELRKLIILTKMNRKFFESLIEGWYYGAGIKIKSSTIDIAETLLNIPCKGKKTDPEPGINGEIQFSVIYKKHFIDVIVFKDNTISLVHEFKEEEKLKTTGFLPEMNLLLTKICGEFK